MIIKHPGELGPLPRREVCGTADFEIGWGYVKKVEIVSDDRSTRRNRLGLSEKTGVDKGLSDESAVGEANGATLSVRCVGGTA
jgi:hypothetical protein